MKRKLLTAFILFSLIAAGSHAQTIRQKERIQRARIKQGVRSGELTRAEAINLARDQKEIRQDVKEARADGVVTKEERKEIKQEQRQASRKIYRKKHNLRDRN
jgi:uncharacterized membrane protein YebE (DUF533 family)